MHCLKKRFMVLALLASGTVGVAQQPSTPPASDVATVRGCLRGERGNYILIADNGGAVYVLKGVGNKLDRLRRHEVEVKGKILPGVIKTGIAPDKLGSNPSDTVHGVDGTPLQVADVDADIHLISKRCKAADQQ